MRATSLLMPATGAPMRTPDVRQLVLVLLQRLFMVAILARKFGLQIRAHCVGRGRYIDVRRPAERPPTIRADGLSE